MNDKQKFQLLSIALLLEENDRLSASTQALKQRAENRRKAKAIALELLGHSDEEFQKIYAGRVDVRELAENLAGLSKLIKD